jgi:hypothetical protein
VTRAFVDLRRPVGVTILAVLHYLIAAAYLFGAVAGSWSIVNGEDFPVIFLAIFGVLGFVHLSTGFGLWKLKRYGQVLQIAFACLGLVVFPLGTLLSTLILVYMFYPRTRVLFSGRTARELSDHEVEILARPCTTLYIAAGVLGMVSVMVFAIVMAIAVPNFIDALNAAKQKRTIVDMHDIGAIVES